MTFTINDIGKPCTASDLTIQTTLDDL